MSFPLKIVGFYDAYEKRTSREKKDSLEFAAAMYTYNRGIFDTGITNILKSCGPEADPAVDCKLDGYGGHSVNIRDACILVDNSPADEIYDYTKLEESYPYDKVEPFYDSIPWDQIRSDVNEAFDIIKASRSKHSGKTYSDGISFRYDWRALLSVVRMRLPPRETLVGPSVQTFTDYWGGKANPVMSSITSPATFQTNYCSLAGGDKELCSSVPQEESSSSSSLPEPSPPEQSSSSESLPSHDSSSSSQKPPDVDYTSKVKTCKRKYYVCRKNRAQSEEKCLGQWKECIRAAGVEGTSCFPNTFSDNFSKCLDA